MNIVYGSVMDSSPHVLWRCIDSVSRMCDKCTKQTYSFYGVGGGRRGTVFWCDDCVSGDMFIYADIYIRHIPHGDMIFEEYYLSEYIGYMRGNGLKIPTIAPTVPTKL